jgi:hypothetical protein
MDLAIGNFFIMYLLLPLVAMLLAVVSYFVAKKNGLLSNKKLILMFLLFCALLALPGLLGFIQYRFMPYIYIGLQVLYFFLGWIFLSIIKDTREKPYYVEFLFVFITMFIGGALFSLVFNLCNSLQYGWWAATCLVPFIFPSVFRKTYETYLAIPLEIRDMWRYDNQSIAEWENKMMDSGKVIVVGVELKKQTSDNTPLNITAKAQEDMPVGVWFKMFIEDYNKKSSEIPISHSDFDSSYGWLFYTLTSVLSRKRYINPNLSFSQNKIKEKRVIIAKRATYSETLGQQNIDN